MNNFSGKRLQLALQKFFWTLVQWNWEGGKAYTEQFDSSQYMDNRLYSVNSEDGIQVVIKGVGPQEE